MINWKEIFGSRCAIDSCYDWLENKISNKKLLEIIEKLGFQAESIEMGKQKTKCLRRNMSKALKRNKV